MFSIKMLIFLFFFLLEGPSSAIGAVLHATSSTITTTAADGAVESSFIYACPVPHPFDNIC